LDEVVAVTGSISVLVIVTPGPDTALTVRNTLLGGRRGGVLTALGVVLGQAVWALATAAGLAALSPPPSRPSSRSSPSGPPPSCFLGAQTLVGALRGAPAGAASHRFAPSRVAPLTALRQDLVSNLTNPKMAAFFPSLLPQFASGLDAGFPAQLGLGLVFCSLTLGG
jgi:threonine/homoserine/homoserine lactone efflux protein